MRRKYPPAPVPAVGAIVVDRRGRVLLVRRASEPARGQWTIPGGGIELGEPLREACAREVHEETGLDVEVGAVVEVVDRIVRDAAGRVAYHYVIVDYLCRSRGGELRAGSDALEARFVTLAEAEALDTTFGLIPLLWRATGGQR